MLSIISLHLSTAGVYFAAYLTEKLQQCNYFFNSLSLRFNGHFPCEPGLAGVY